MRCEHCKQAEAQIHLKQIVNAHQEERHLCRACFQAYQAENLHDMLGFSGKPGSAPSHGHHENWVKTFFAPQPEQDHPARTTESTTVCAGCGMTWLDFQQNGLLGCAQCYQVFGDRMPQLLRKIHGHTKHVGKQPHVKPASPQLDDPGAILQQTLKQAIADEAYEEAAVLRDQIKALQETRQSGDDADAD